jgi:hypothetical protein
MAKQATLFKDDEAGLKKGISFTLLPPLRIW